jgi:hypothetical protein
LRYGSVVGREKLEDVEQYRRSIEVASRVYSLFKEKIGYPLQGDPEDPAR